MDGRRAVHASEIPPDKRFCRKTFCYHSSAALVSERELVVSNQRPHNERLFI